MKNHILRSSLISLCIIFASFELSYSQTSSSETAEIQIADVQQTVVGFGASLAYYENWLTAHPNKAVVYDIIFKDLSLDILRLRNAYAYDPGMIGRVKEFYLAAETSLGHPIETMACSWSPAGEVKSNNHHKGAGGTLKYTVEDGTVQFDYSGFANWWDESLDEYESNGIYPDYISIQNEPDWPADYESCRLDPEETITSSDTIAAYNTALDSVYNKVIERVYQPKIIGPETIGIGYNAVEKYVNKLDETKIDAISHHLYHGVSEVNPFASTDFTKVGNFHPEIPHFQTEFYRGDWFSLGGLIYKSFHDENVAAYLFWALTWGNEGGLVALENPWSSGSWTDPAKGYIINKEYYAFKQFSAFIHPGWSRLGSVISSDDGKDLAFVSPDKDSAAYVIVNRSLTNEQEMHLSFPGYSIDESEIYITSDDLNCEMSGSLANSAFLVPPHSIVTVAMEISESDPDALVEQIFLTPEMATIDIYAESILITPEILPANASKKVLYWEITSGMEYAQITQLGYLEALGAGDGTVTVRATATDGSGIYSEVNIDITNQILISSINLSATKTNIEERFDSTLITAAVLPENASNQDVTWEVINGSNIARLESTGWLYALGTGDGDVRVRVSANDASGKLKEVIIKLFNQVPLESIEIIAPSDAIDTYQGTMQLSAEFTPEGASNKEVTWSIEDGALLATIDQSGMLEALGIENGEITVKAESQEDPEIFDLSMITLSEQVVGIAGQETNSFKAWSTRNSISFTLPASNIGSQIILYSIEGRKLHQIYISPHSTGGTISMEQFEDHIYLLELKNDHERHMLKIAYVNK